MNQIEKTIFINGIENELITDRSFIFIDSKGKKSVLKNKATITRAINKIVESGRPIPKNLADYIKTTYPKKEISNKIITKQQLREVNEDLYDSISAVKGPVSDPVPPPSPLSKKKEDPFNTEEQARVADAELQKTEVVQMEDAGNINEELVLEVQKQENDETLKEILRLKKEVETTKKGIAKTETIGEKDVAADFAELLFEVAIAVESLADERFERRNVYIDGVDPAAGDPPLTGLYERPHAFEFIGVVLLHEHVPKGAFETEHVIGVGLHECDVSPEGLRNILFDALLNSPPPLRVQVCGADDVEFRALRLWSGALRLRTSRGAGQEEEDGEKGGFESHGHFPLSSIAVC